MFATFVVIELLFYYCSVFFFFQAEDGIRDHCVTGVQTCALPISRADLGRDFEIRRLVADHDRAREVERQLVRRAQQQARLWLAAIAELPVGRRPFRSEERRVGKECRSGWSPYRKKKKRSNRRVRV